MTSSGIIRVYCCVYVCASPWNRHKKVNLVSRSDMAAADNAFEHKLYQRTDSGQYADIYESL